MIKQLMLVSVLGLGLTACGSDGVAATATEGDVFCNARPDSQGRQRLAQRTGWNRHDKLKVELSGAIDSLTAAVAKAPKDIADTAETCCRTK